jgi:hypothetical protein
MLSGLTPHGFSQSIWKIMEDHSGVCELFSKYFSSVYEEVYDVPSTSTTCKSSLSTITISVEEEEKKLKILDLKKGAGPDGFLVGRHRQCAARLSIIISVYFV